MLKYILVLLMGLSGAQSSMSYADSSSLTPQQIVAASDRTRGGGLSGIEWKIDITGEDGKGPLGKHSYLVKASGNNSLAQTLYPPRNRGTRLLQLERNMWFGKPSLSKPVSISARQKMIGMASNGDIASTNYANDYNATVLRSEPVNGEDSHVLELLAKNRFVTYDRIVYYVSSARLVPLKAEFYTVSGKLFKTASFDAYSNLELNNGKHQLFIKNMTIRDAIERSNYSVLDYQDVKLQTFAADTFSIDSLNRP